jgi:hypothetical protein
MRAIDRQEMGSRYDEAVFLGSARAWIAGPFYSMMLPGRRLRGRSPRRQRSGAADRDARQGPPPGAPQLRRVRTAQGVRTSLPSRRLRRSEGAGPSKRRRPFRSCRASSERWSRVPAGRQVLRCGRISLHRVQLGDPHRHRPRSLAESCELRRASAQPARRKGRDGGRRP